MVHPLDVGREAADAIHHFLEQLVHGGGAIGGHSERDHLVARVVECRDRGLDVMAVLRCDVLVHDRLPALAQSLIDSSVHGILLSDSIRRVRADSPSVARRAQGRAIGSIEQQRFPPARPWALLSGGAEAPGVDRNGALLTAQTGTLVVRGEMPVAV